MADYIKREDALKIIFDVKQMSTGKTDNLTEVVDCISNLKAEDVAPVRHGKWIFTKNATSFGCYYTCSECGRVSFLDINYKPNYCDRCGVKMDGE